MQITQQEINIWLKQQRNAVDDVSPEHFLLLLANKDLSLEEFIKELLEIKKKIN
jgi:hypothetical protein